MDHLQIKYPYEIRDVDSGTNADLLKYYKGERTGFVQVGPEGYLFPYKYKDQAELYYNFESRPDDVWISTVPRSGTTWTQEMIWLLANDLNFEQAQQRMLTARFPFFEYSVFVHDAIKDELMELNKNCDNNMKMIENLCSSRLDTLNAIPRNQRRFIKTHLPFSLMPPSVFQNKCKIVYVTRNPKDVAVSYFHMHRSFRTMGYTGEFERFWRHFKNGLNFYLPYDSHVKEARGHMHLPNVLYLNYESILTDLKVTIIKVGDFLNSKPTAEGIEKLVNHLSIENFSKNTSVNLNHAKDLGIINDDKSSFVRKGANSSNGKDNEQQEFVDNPHLLQSANAWVQQYNTNFKNS